jgi:hypothetical protein
MQTPEGYINLDFHSSMHTLCTDAVLNCSSLGQQWGERIALRRSITSVGAVAAI